MAHVAHTAGRSSFRPAEWAPSSQAGGGGTGRPAGGPISAPKRRIFRKCGILPTVLCVRPWNIRQATAWVSKHHRRLPRIQGGLWAIRLELDGEIVGCAIVGRPSRTQDQDVLCVTRVAVVDGVKNGCSKLYGACSQAARAIGATGLCTYTHLDEPGTSLIAAGWVRSGITKGGEYNRPCRFRRPAIDPMPKVKWIAPWSRSA